MEQKDPVENILAMEAARASVFRKFEPSSISGGSKPLQHLCYNLTAGKHFRHDTLGNPRLPHRFCDMLGTAASLFFTTTNAVAHMNGIKGASLLANQRPPVEVRTFVEISRGDQTKGLNARTCPSLRVHHISYPLANGAVQQKQNTEKETEGNEDASDSDDANMEVSGEDEEEIRRKEKQEASKKKKTKDGVPAASLGQRRATFAGGFESGLYEAAEYMKNLRETEKNDKLREEFKLLQADVLPRFQNFVFQETKKIEASLQQDSTGQQYTKILHPYLRSDTRSRVPHEVRSTTVDETEAFIDSRAVADFDVSSVVGRGDRDSYEQYEKKINPEAVLDPITAMVYHTQGIDPQQLDIRNYFSLSDAQLKDVLTLHAKKTGNTQNAGEAEGPMDPSEIMDVPMEVLHSMINMSVTEKHRHVEKLFTTDPERIEYMRAARISAADFKGFPFPENVYEIPKEFVCPEILWRMPLPQVIGTTLSPSAVNIHDEHHRAYVSDLVRITDITQQNRSGNLANVMSADQAQAKFGGMVIAVFNELKRINMDMNKDKKMRWLTPKSLLALMKQVAIPNMSYGATLKAVSDLQASFFYHINFRTIAEQTRNNILFRDTLDLEYNNYLSPSSDVSIQATASNMKEVVDVVEGNNALEVIMDNDDEDGDNQKEAEMNGTSFLGNIPLEIIERDDALQANITNSKIYAQLAFDATHGKGMTKETYKSLLWSKVRDATERADDLWHNSDNIDSRSKEIRKWFHKMSPKEREVEFRMIHNVRPYTACRMWVNESMSSPVLNLSQNTIAMSIAFFASLHHCRWYERTRDPKLNFLMAGDGASGKSFIMHALERIMPTGIITTVTHMSNHALHVRKNMDGFLYIQHEFQRRYLFPALPGKDGATGESGDAISFFKDRLTRGMVSVVALEINKKTKVRDVLMFDASCQSTCIGATNDSLAGADENILTRFIILSVPKPRDMAEGTHPADRPDLDMDGEKLAFNHFGQRTKLYHQLLRYRYAYSEFMVKCGVLSNGMQSFGGRLLIDNILNEASDKFSIDTRDPRKRKMTEEMARCQALFYANFMGLGSPLALMYKTSPNAPDIYSWTAWLYCVVPYMYIAKDHCIDALTLLESIWSPQYLTRILFTIAFDIAQIHELSDNCFRHIYRPVEPTRRDETEDAPSEEDRTVDYNYIVVRDRNGSRQSIHNKIADALGKYGIRAADVDQFLSKLTKQYIPTHNLVKRGPAPVVTGETPAAAAPVSTPPPETMQGKFPPDILKYGAELPVAPSGKRILQESTIGSDLSRSLAAVGEQDETRQSGGSLPPSEDSMLANEIDRQFDAMEKAAATPKPTSPPKPTVVPKEVHGTDAIHIEYDLNNEAVRFPIVKYEYIVPGNPRSGTQLCISTTFMEDRLKFKISDAAGMREVRAKDKTAPHAMFPDVPVDRKEAGKTDYYSGKGTKWGNACDADFKKRMTLARKMANASRDLTSPILKCIEAVLSNKYLEMPDPEDEDANALIRELTRNYNADFEKSDDPTKHYHLPWMKYVTSIPVSDYVLESRDKKRFPEGRRIPFHDMLKIMPLHRNENNNKMIHRNNYSRLSLFAQSMIDFEPVGDGAPTGETTERATGEFVSSTYRYRIMNTSKGIRVSADIDYYEAMERMNSIAHPGFELAVLPLHIGWPPVTYHNIRLLFRNMKDAGVIKRFAPLHDNSWSIAEEFGIILADQEETWKYPEDDPSLELEYPTHHLVKRVREFEEQDRNEVKDDMSHLTPASSIYCHKNMVGNLYFDTREAITKRYNDHLTGEKTLATLPSPPTETSLNTMPSMAGFLKSIGGKLNPAAYNPNISRGSKWKKNPTQKNDSRLLTHASAPPTGAKRARSNDEPDSAEGARLLEEQEPSLKRQRLEVRDGLRSITDVLTAPPPLASLQGLNLADLNFD